MFRLSQATALSCLLYVCWGSVGCSPESAPPFDPAFLRLSPKEIFMLPMASRFDAPMGGENGAFTYNAQPFRITRHLGDDLNGIGGWNSDLGDPVYASGDGRVLYAREATHGWGKMIILGHRIPDENVPVGYEVIQTVYAHLDEIDEKVEVGGLVARGQKIGTVGTANGMYFAHLHFEVRKSRSINPGVGYSDSPLDRISPAYLLREFGPATEEFLISSPRFKK